MINNPSFNYLSSHFLLGNLVDTFSNMSNAKFYAFDKDIDSTISNNTGGMIIFLNKRILNFG